MSAGLGSTARLPGSQKPIKQPLKRVEIPLHKFNDVAVPHHVDLLKRHKSNIEKFQFQEAWDRVHREQINATRLVKQLKALLYEMDVLRNQVQDSDLPKFDRLTAVARQNAQDAITEYLQLIPKNLTLNSSSITSTTSGSLISNNDRIEQNNDEEEEELVKLQVQINVKNEELAKQQQCLKSWECLQTEVQDINELFKDFSQIVYDQQENVDHVESSVETAADNVEKGASHLRHVKTAIYPLAGAMIGGCLGGPIGLLAGMKLGGLAALGCGFIGFTGGKFLKKKKEEELNQYGTELLNISKNRNVKGSASLPDIANSELPSGKWNCELHADM